MMDHKYLSEIKARCNEGRPTARIDVKALITEVERLTAENIDYPHLEKEVVGQQKQNARLRKIIDNRDQQIATLKKALELAIAKIGSCNNCDQNCNFCALKEPDYYIQQTQQTHETQEASL